MSWVFPMASDQHAWLQAVCRLPGGSYIYAELPKEKNSISISKVLKIPKIHQKYFHQNSNIHNQHAEISKLSRCQ